MNQATLFDGISSTPRKRKGDPIRADAARRSYWKRVEQRRAAARKYRRENRDERNAYQRAYAAKHHERHAEYRAAWRVKNPESALRTHLKYKYNLSLDEYKRLLIVQKGCCAICGRSGFGNRNGGVRLHLDHDHLTDKPRGLLCGTCNRGIGQLGDNFQRAHAAAKYLERFAHPIDRVARFITRLEREQIESLEYGRLLLET